MEDLKEENKNINKEKEKESIQEKGMNQLTKHRKRNWILLTVFILLSQFTYAMMSVESEEEYASFKILNIFHQLFPFTNKTGFTANTSLSAMSSDMIAGLITSASYIITTIAFIYVGFLLTQKVVYIITSSEEDRSENWAKTTELLSLALVAALSFPSMSVDVSSSGGMNYKVTIPQYVMFDIFEDVITGLEKNGNKDLTEVHLIPEVKLKQPKYFKADIVDFTRSFLTTYVPEEGASLTVKEDDGNYIARFAAGQNVKEYTFKENILLNDKVSQFLEYDLKKNEKEFVVFYFEKLLEHATQTKQALKDVVMMDKAEDANLFSMLNGLYGSEAKYDGNYREYCETINTVPDRMTSQTLNMYLDISASCFSEKMMAELYSNPNYDYLDVFFNHSGSHNFGMGSTMLFGFTDKNSRLSTEDVLQEARSVCKNGGFLACSVSMDYAYKKYEESDLQFGMFTLPVNMLDNTLNRVIDYSNLMLVSRTQSEESVESSGYKDYGDTISGETLKTIPFKMDGRTFENYSYDDFLSVLATAETISYVKNPANTIRMLFNEDSENVFNRFNTCIKYPETYKNGFRCQDLRGEVTSIALSLNRMGLEAWITSGMINGVSHNTKTKVDKERDHAAGSAAVTQKVVKYFDLGSRIAALAAIDSAFEEPDYYLSSPAPIALFAYFLTPKLKEAFSGLLASTGKKMMLFGWTLLTTFTLITFFLIINFLKKLCEILIEIIMFPIIIFLAVFAEGFAGIETKWKEFFEDLGALVLFAFSLHLIPNIIDSILIASIWFIEDKITMSFSSLTSFIANFPEVFIYVMVMFFAMVGFVKGIGETINGLMTYVSSKR